jgi:hypothetical protein
MPLSRIQKVGIAVVGGAAALLVGSKAFAKPRKSISLQGCDPTPYVWSEVSVRQEIDDVIDTGNHNVLSVATEVATRLFGNYPGGGIVHFPPGESAPNGVACIWSRVITLVQVIFDERGIIPGEDGGKKPFEIIDPLIRVSPNPTPGFLYQVQYGKQPEVGGMLKLAGVALESVGVPDTAANKSAYCQLIECSPWNDALYNVPDAGCKKGPGGRGLTLNPRHADNRTRMLQGLPPKRTAVTKTKDNGGGRHALMWLPKIEPNAPVPIVALNDDGSNGINPPRAVLAFGMESVPPGNYGCDPWAADAEPLVL